MGKQLWTLIYCYVCAYLQLALTDKYSSGDLKDGCKDAGLRESQDLGADAGPEWIGDVVRADPKGQYKRHYKTNQYYPKHFGRVRIHHNCWLLFHLKLKNQKAETNFY